MIDWVGSIHCNDNGLEKLLEIWGGSFYENVKVMAPNIANHISKWNLGVVGIKWTAQETNGD
jgi:hypothetical protein